MHIYILTHIRQWKPTTIATGWSVPQNQIFGSSEPFFIETLGMLQNVLARQVVGATPVDPEMQGILRVHVFSNTGLVLDNIANVHISPPFPGTPWTPIACHSTESTPRNRRLCRSRPAFPSARAPRRPPPPAAPAAAKR